jgi:hypothetical protein
VERKSAGGDAIWLEARDQLALRDRGSFRDEAETRSQLTDDLLGCGESGASAIDFRKRREGWDESGGTCATFPRTRAAWPRPLRARGIGSQKANGDHMEI